MRIPARHMQPARSDSRSSTQSAHIPSLRAALLPAVLLMSLAWSCAAVKPQLQSVDGPYVVQEGDEAQIRWRFSDADSVRFENDPRSFMPSDSVRFFPTETREYKIVGLRDEHEIAAYWPITVARAARAETVYVDRDEPRSANLPPCSHFHESRLHSYYLTGYAEAAAGVPELQMKVMRVHSDADGAPNAFDVILMDQFGNYLPSLGADDVDWRIGFDCFASDVAYEVTPEVREYIAPDNGLGIAVVVDQAAYMRPYVPTLDVATQDMLCTLGPDDRFSLVRFDHRVETLIAAAPPAEARAAWRSVDFERYGGLTALYRAAMQGIFTLESSPSAEKCLVLVAGGSEDASLIYTINDVAERARRNGIVVYSVALGDNVDSYALRYLSAYTGGRYYGVPADDYGQLRAALNEVVNSYRTFYRLTPREGEVPLKSLDICRDGVQADVQFARVNTAVRNEQRRTMVPMKNYDPQHQILSVFSHAATAPDDRYDGQLDLLAQTLRDNPGKNIELIGHASLSGSDLRNAQLANERARRVRQALQARGVEPERIRLRGEGAETPVYYLESEQWQAANNRRVEIRWLDPALAPYEIAAQSVDTEEEAIDAAEEWQRRGVNAYYEMRMLRGVPRFQVHLWGYTSEAEARAAKSALQARFGVRLSVL